MIREVIREVPAAAGAAPPPPNRPPTFNGPIQANPPVLEPGQSTNLSAPATDPDGDTMTYTWSAPAGSFSSQNGMNTIWTAPNQEGNYPLTVTANDGRGGTATNTITMPVMRRAALVFDDVHFDFDKSNLKPEAIRILDDAVMKLQANPALNVTIEGHTDSVGTAEYNLSLGERRANAVRDYLLNRGIAAARHADGELRRGAADRRQRHGCGTGDEPPRAYRDDDDSVASVRWSGGQAVSGQRLPAATVR